MGRVGSTIAVIAAVLGAALPTAAAAPASDKRPPNIVVVMTDDQDVRSMHVMNRVERLLGERGVELTESIVADPLCCPSRATYLTGQYAHNHGVLRNNPPYGGFPALIDRETLPVWLHRAGYYTAHVGKYLNFYGGNVIPRGWDEWHSLSAQYVNRMWGYLINDDGTKSFYGQPDVEEPAFYQTDVLAEKAIDLIAERSARRKPLFLSVSTLAPHAEDGDVVETPPNPRPAPRHAGAFAGRPLPSSPAFAEADVSDKPREIQALPLPSAAGVAEAWRARLGSLLAVDEMVGGIVRALRESGELRRTILIFTSDNGFLLGEHRIVDKIHPYEESIRVPLFIRGPGIPRGEEREGLVSNIDLAPTITDLAGARRFKGLPSDGRSFMPLITEKRVPGRALLVEAWCGTHEPCWDASRPTRPRYVAVRTPGYVYIEHATGERELYDLVLDRHQLESRHADPAYAAIRVELAALLAELRNCDGARCDVDAPAATRRP